MRKRAVSANNSDTFSVKGWLSKNKYRIAWFVLITSVVVYIFVRTPFGFFDEQVHYVRALGVANGQLLSYSQDESDSRIGHDIDMSNLAYMDQYANPDREYIGVGWINDAIGNTTASDREQYRINTSAAAYMPISYIPYAIGAKVSQAINLNMDAQLIMMRLFGALTTLGIVFAAYRISLNKYKWTILAIALIPMSVAAFGAITTDGYTIAAALLFMASIMRLIASVRAKKVTSKDMLLLGVASLLVVTAKMPTFLMISLILGVLVIFWRKFTSKQRWILLVIMAGSALITLLWAYYAKDINTGAFWGKDVSTTGQIAYILSQPLTFIKNLLYSVLSYDYSNIPYNLYADSGFYTSLPFVVDLIVIGGVLLSSFVDRSYVKPERTEKVIYWLQFMLYAIITCAVFTLLYLQFTPIGTANEIQGIQPRYFLPFIVLLAMMPFVLKLTRGWTLFVYVAPFIGIGTYLLYIVMQVF